MMEARRRKFDAEEDADADADAEYGMASREDDYQQTKAKKWCGVGARRTEAHFASRSHDSVEASVRNVPKLQGLTRSLL
ncbi:hypothetical protein VDGL01_08706 [Verticillium dahliae]